MADTDLIIAKLGKQFQGFLISEELGRETVSQGPTRLFGQDYNQKDTFCEWFEVVSEEDGRFVGVCFTDFSNAATESVMRGLEAENTLRTDDGVVLLLRAANSWKVLPGPYLPVYFLRAEDGGCCYLVPSAFGPRDELPDELKQVSSLDEISEAARQWGRV